MDIEEVRADRLSSLRTLAAGAANEINSPLTSVLANLEHVLRRLRALGSGSPEDVVMLEIELPALIEALARAVEAAGRVRQLTHALMVFSRGGVERRHLIDVRSVVEGAIHLANPEIRPRAHLVKSLREAPPVEADESLLAQAFLSLLVNAAQSIPEGGSQRHEVRVATGTDAEGRAVIEICDTGGGISPEILPYVFDPFFTTRPARGVGLGLSVAHGAVTSLGGEMTVESEVGEGSIVRVVLPPARSQQSEPRRVLVIGDDPTSGNALALALSEGHAPLVAEDAADALVRLSEEPFDAVVCDTFLPGMCAIEFYAEAVRRAPRIAERFVFLTGGAMTPRIRSFLEGIGHRCMEKPPDMPRLRELLRRVTRAR